MDECKEDAESSEEKKVQISELNIDPDQIDSANRGEASPQSIVEIQCPDRTAPINKIPGDQSILQNKSAVNEEACIICYASPPNAIFGDCGHGGTLFLPRSLLSSAPTIWKRQGGPER